MSHIAKINVVVKDLDSLRKAAERLGLELDTKKKAFRYYAGQTHACEAVLRVKGNSEAYEMGVTKTAAGYGLEWDSFLGGKGLVDKVGTGARKLTQEYATQVAIKNVTRQGYQVQRVVKEDGTIILKASK